MVSWQPIERGKPEVHGVDSKYPGLLDVTIPLKPSPPQEWIDFFNAGRGVPMNISMHRPKASGSTVRITPPDGEVKRYVDHVDERIAAANTEYERDVVPRLEREEQARLAHEERLEAARREVDDL